MVDRYSLYQGVSKNWKIGRHKKTKKLHLKKLKYVQIIKERDRKNLINITKRVIFGNSDNISDFEISTSHIE